MSALDPLLGTAAGLAQATGLDRDLRFLRGVRRALVPLPWDAAVSDTAPFPPREKRAVPALRGRRVALVATGGSGALASVVGVWRAMEEAGARPSVVSVCSGSSLFGFALAAGVDPDELAAFVVAHRREDFVDLNWRDMASASVRRGRGFAGIIRGERLERSYRRLLGDMRLGDLPIPCYAPLWNVEENRLEYAGPRTHPDLPVARAIRAAITIPLFLDPVAVGRHHWCDGGIVDIFPVRPVLEIEEPCEVAVCVNGFYPREFAGEPVVGWRRRSLSILHLSGQMRTAQHAGLARSNLRALRERCQVVMLDPVPFSEVRGIGFYTQFLDRTDWPDFMRWGHEHARRALQALPAPRTAARPASGARTAARRRRS